MWCWAPNRTNIHSSVSCAERSSSSAAIASWSRSAGVGTVPESVTGGGFMKDGWALDRALPLSPHYLVRARSVPVDELFHRLQAELGGQGQLLDRCFERLGTYPLDEGVELLALVAVGLVEVDPALDGLGDAFRRQAGFEPGAEDDLAALEVAADVRDVGGHLATADLQRGAVEADVGDVVLAA